MMHQNTLLLNSPMPNILILSFYFPPDLSAGSFRMDALIKALEPYAMQKTLQVDVLTTLPNRYHQFSANALEAETYHHAQIKRIALPTHKNGFVDQAKVFFHYFSQARRLAKTQHYDLVFSTSSRLFTAFLGAHIAKRQHCPLFLDIRDIFTETMESILPFPLKQLCLPVFKYVEKLTFKQASALNMVSQGFADYIELKVSKDCQLSYISNGVDACFLGIDYTKSQETSIKTVLYVGNIGEGQGLDKIIPALAKATQGQCRFLIIGSGGRQAALQASCQGLENITLHPPVPRDQLIEHYKQADILFVHLNDYPAFKRVLPSKLFEYAVTQKPLLAGIPGYSAEFVKTHIFGSWLFAPCDVEGGVDQLHALLREGLKAWDRSAFCQQFDRGHLMQRLSKNILRVLPK